MSRVSPRQTVLIPTARIESPFERETRRRGGPAETMMARQRGQKALARLRTEETGHLDTNVATLFQGVLKPVSQPLPRRRGVRE